MPYPTPSSLAESSLPLALVAASSRRREADTRFKHKKTLNGMKVGALPTQAKADTVTLFFSEKKNVVASLECPRTYIFKD